MAESKAEVEAAYEAGKALPTVQWAADSPVDTTLGLHHNPFDERDQPKQYKGYAEGLGAALEERAKQDSNRDDVLAQIKKVTA